MRLRLDLLESKSFLRVRKFTQLMANHVLRDSDWYIVFAIMYLKANADKVGQYCA